MRVERKCSTTCDYLNWTTVCEFQLKEILLAIMLIYHLAFLPCSLSVMYLPRYATPVCSTFTLSNSVWIALFLLEKSKNMILRMFPSPSCKWVCQMGDTVFHFQVWLVDSPEKIQKTSFSRTIFIAWGLSATEMPFLGGWKDRWWRFHWDSNQAGNISQQQLQKNQGILFCVCSRVILRDVSVLGNFWPLPPFVSLMVKAAL